MAIMGIPVQVKTDNAPIYFSCELKVFFKYHDIKNSMGIPQNSIGQAVVEKSKHTLKYILSNQKAVLSTPRDKLHNASIF